MGESMQNELVKCQQERVLESLDCILEREDFMVCDSSVMDQVGSSYYRGHIHNVNRFSELDFGPTERQIEYVKKFIEILRNPKAITSSGVASEFGSLISIMENKIKHLFHQERTHARQHGRKFNGDGENWTTEKNLLNEIYDSLVEAQRQSERICFSPKQKNAYGFVEKIVMGVAEKTAAKIDYGDVYDKSSAPRRVQDFHTDEQLVAIALYKSIFENGSGGILTRDSDIRRVLFNTLSYMSYNQEDEYKSILEANEHRGIRIYEPKEENQASLVYDSSKFNLIAKRKGISPKDIIAIRASSQKNNPFH